MTGFICTRGGRRRRCSTQGCTGNATLECDWPIRPKEAADRKWTPKVGDVRFHLAQRRLYYVHVAEVFGEGPPRVTVARNPPPSILQGELLEPDHVVTCDWDYWYTALRPTCNRAVCARCAVKFLGRLDFCAAHGRQLAKGVDPSEG